jgi:peptidoglycan/LPS O-acetylase OafA/YrhL
MNLRALDVLRGLLAMYVVAGHARWLLWVGNSEWVRSSPHPWWQNALATASASLRYGHEAVIVFFVLSGFFIHLTAAKRLSQAGNVEFSSKDFFRRRVRRLVPGYIWALALTCAFDLIGRHVWPALYFGRTGDQLLDANFLAGDYSPKAVVPALFMLPGAGGARFGSNGPLWSLAYEVVYYLLYPFWLRLRVRSGSAAYALGALLLLSAAIPQISDSFSVIVLSHYPIWLAGAGLAELAMRGLLPRNRMAALAGIVLLGVAAADIVSLQIVRLILYMIGGTLIVVTFVGMRNAYAGGLFRVGELMGVSSYSIYVCHFPVLACFSAICFRLFSTRLFSGWIALTAFLTSVLIGCLSFALIERRFLPKRRQRVASMDNAVVDSFALIGNP